MATVRKVSTPTLGLTLALGLDFSFDADYWFGMLTLILGLGRWLLASVTSTVTCMGVPIKAVVMTLGLMK